jgi:hypothetical protein
LGRVAEQLMRETAREERRPSLLGLRVRRESLERAVVRGNGIGNATVPQGGRACCKFIRAVRVQSGDRWKRHAA